jgi:hypothetical protein
MFSWISAASTSKVALVCVLVAVAATDLLRRIQHRPSHLMAATVLGCTLAVGIVRGSDAVLTQTIETPIIPAVLVVLILIGWYILFGPWEIHTKTSVLLSFLLCIAYRTVRGQTPQELLALAIAAASALIPAFVWGRLFLKYHRERFVAVFLLFLAGILSTLPILFYDALARRSLDLNFVFLKLHPETFQSVVSDLVRRFMTDGTTSMLLVSSILTFLCVAFIEEMSKYWVLRHSCRALFRSIDDVLELSIIVAIGFAFAENVINPTYFTSFVSDYLLHGTSPDIGAFVGNVLGRSVLTSMVHIVSTGVIGYASGIAFFAPSYIDDLHMKRREPRLSMLIVRVLPVSPVAVFRWLAISTGIIAAVLLHGIFNVLVSLSDILPGNPQTLQDIFGPASPGFFARIPFLLLPSLFYVVGGFWLLTSLFERQMNERERGERLVIEQFVAA